MRAMVWIVFVEKHSMVSKLLITFFYEMVGGGGRVNGDIAVFIKKMLHLLIICKSQGSRFSRLLKGNSIW